MPAAPSQSRPGRRLCVIFNPVAGAHRRQRMAAVQRRLVALGCTVELRETRGPEHAIELARSADPATTDAVVAAGGDGTINEVINGLAGSPLPLGILALGTANVLALEAGLPTDPLAAADVVATGVPRPVHLGRAGARRFAVMASVGLDARVVARVRPSLKRRLGRLAYAWETLVCGLGYDFPVCRAVVDGVAHEAAGIIVCNGRHYGGRFVMAPAADLAVPSLEVVLLKRGGRIATMRYLTALARGRLHRRADVAIVSTHRVRLEGPTGAPVQGDGDLIGQLPVDVSVADELLSLLTPGD